MGLAFFQAGIAAAAATLLLGFLYGGCESNLCKFVAHMISFPDGINVERSGK